MIKLMRAMKIFGIAALVLVALLLLGYGILYWIISSRLEAKLQALRDAGEPLALRELARPVIHPEQNAATYIRRARADMSALGKELAPLYEHGDQEEDYQRTEADNKAFRAALEAYPKMFVLLEHAAACPDSNMDLDYTVAPEAFIKDLVPQVQVVREVVRLLAERIRLQVADGKSDEALQSVIAIFRLSRHQEREPTMINYLVVCACRSIGVEEGNRVLRSGPVSAKSRADLDAELAVAASNAAYVRVLKTERVLGLEMLHGVTNGLNGLYFNDEQCFYLDLMAQNIDLAPRTFADAAPAYDKLLEETKSWRHRVSSLVVPAAARLHGAEVRTRAWVRCLRVLNALQKKPANAEASQPKLEELGLPAEAITDPFNGAPLHLRRVGGEWVIYSVGQNLVDDGGELKDRKDVGIGPIAAKGS
jgi:hypothetical protein